MRSTKLPPHCREKCARARMLLVPLPRDGSQNHTHCRVVRTSLLNDKPRGPAIGWMRSFVCDYQPRSIIERKEAFTDEAHLTHCFLRCLDYVRIGTEECLEFLNRRSDEHLRRHAQRCHRAQNHQARAGDRRSFRLRNLYRRYTIPDRHHRKLNWHRRQFDDNLQPRAGRDRERCIERRKADVRRAKVVAPGRETVKPERASRVCRLGTCCTDEPHPGAKRCPFFR
jgi:hypothetical protein